jgi:hypothetical protein
MIWGILFLGQSWYLLEKITYNLCSLNLIFTIFKKKVDFDHIAYYNIVTIRIDIFYFQCTISSILVFSSYTYFLLGLSQMTDGGVNLSYKDVTDGRMVTSILHLTNYGQKA